MSYPALPSGKLAHTTVKLNYLPRVIGLFLNMLMLISVFHPISNSLLWAGILTYGLIWPHIAYLTAKNSVKSREAEIRNMLMDSFILGVWLNLVSFRHWPAAGIIVISCMNNMATDGFRLFFRGLILTIAGALLAGFFTGFDYIIESNLSTSLISFSAVFVQTLLVAFLSNRLTKSVAKTRKELKIKNVQLEGLSSKLSKYLSPQVYNSIFIGEKEVKIQTDRKKLTIFFSDIKDFTEITDSIESEALSSLLNSYLTEMSEIALRYGGTIDKFVGDAIMIFFGDPETKGGKEDALACVLMAIEMRERMKHLQRQWEEEGLSRKLQIRIGINTGHCTVGNFGSEDRLDYTIIGGQVNLASRLESSAEPDQILISQETYALVKDKIACEKKGEIKVKGIAYPVQTYHVVDLYENLAITKRELKEERMGFLLSIDFEKMVEDEAIESLRKVIIKIEERKNST